MGFVNLNINLQKYKIFFFKYYFEFVELQVGQTWFKILCKYADKKKFRKYPSIQ